MPILFWDNGIVDRIVLFEGISKSRRACKAVRSKLFRLIVDFKFHSFEFSI
jgi:hypothetical protein